MGKEKLTPQERVIRILSGVHINAKYGGYEFLNGTTKYAHFKLTSNRKFAEDLEEEINSHFREENGDIVRIRFIDYKALGKDKFFYVAEIVPDESLNLSAGRKTDETEKFLTSLPHFVTGYLKKCGSRS